MWTEEQRWLSHHENSASEMSLENRLSCKRTKIDHEAIAGGMGGLGEKMAQNYILWLPVKCLNCLLMKKGESQKENKMLACEKKFCWNKTMSDVILVSTFLWLWEIPFLFHTCSTCIRRWSLFLVMADWIETLRCANDKCNGWRMHIFILNNLFLLIKECFANVETCFVAILRDVLKCGFFFWTSNKN